MHTWSPIIVAHTAAAFAAFLIGLIMFVSRKGNQKHRWIGRSWVLLLAFTALSSFFIKTLGQFSWIHLISIGTLYYLVRAVYYARKGEIERHKYSMIGLYLGSLVIAGLFTFMPGRLLHQTLLSILANYFGRFA
jgi:uncharacterized membrane protein